MTRPPFSIVFDLFERACSVPEREWHAFLAEHARGDDRVVAEVLSLLRDHREGDGSLVDAARNAVARERAAGAPLPAAIGPYRIVRQLGQGGMGTVYEALQEQPVRRRVALKVMNHAQASAEFMQRFERERQTLAMMAHDGIAKVHECGATEQGQPFLAMEFVQGEEITTYCDRRRLPLWKRIRLVRQLCDAVHHLHRRGMIHRDLKPGNVLVTDTSGVLQVKLIDFGLVKSIEAELPAADFRTVVGDFGGGTPVYMAPEQAGASDSLDTLVDVYSIGVLLYELLVGSLPLPAELLFRDGGVDMLRLLRDHEPDRPSVRFDRCEPADARRTAELRQTSVAELRTALTRDLDWIVMRALHKDPSLRYPGAAEFAADLKRYQRDEPVEARPPSRLYLARKFARRNRGMLAVAAFVALVLAIAGGFSAVSAVTLDRTVQRYEQLEGVILLGNLHKRDREAVETPAFAPELGSWLADADALLARRPSVEATVAELAGRRDLSAEDHLQEELRQLLVGMDWLAGRRDEVQRAIEWNGKLVAATDGRSDVPSWQQVRRSLAESPIYRDADCRFEIDDVVDLIPIGVNAATGHWEFYHPRSGCDADLDPRQMRVPNPDERGNVRGRDDFGIVFVLVPGGTTRIGAPSGSSMARLRERPQQTRELAPYLLARHELTRAQWRRLGGPIDLDRLHNSETHPIGDVTWSQAEHVLARHGLRMPSETEWEHACRAGTTTPWWTGSDPEVIEALEPLQDKRSKDELSVTVGASRGNRWGFYDMHGNVREWCRDPAQMYGDYDQVAPDGLGIVDDLDHPVRIARGGSFRTVVSRACAHTRHFVDPNNRETDLGVRAARPWRRR